MKWMMDYKIKTPCFQSVHMQWRLKHYEQSENFKTLHTNIHHYKGYFSLYNQYKLLLININSTNNLANFWRYLFYKFIISFFFRSNSS